MGRGQWQWAVPKTLGIGTCPASAHAATGPDFVLDQLFAISGLAEQYPEKNYEIF